MRARMAAIKPRLGVRPPASSAAASSSRCAPPRSAASAEAAQSTQTSKRMLFAAKGFMQAIDYFRKADKFRISTLLRRLPDEDRRLPVAMDGSRVRAETPARPDATLREFARAWERAPALG